MNASELAHALDRVSTTARVLYVAAHPDDENTRLLTYLTNGRHVTAAYLSLTRGGGGQNLIGAEQAEMLDVVRTEELLAARRLDSAWQRFTRARDFGYSKSAEETLRLWGHNEMLADVVWVIRAFEPDVIITRFDETPPNHGHHTASAILAREAFEAAGRADRFKDQLARGVKPWQAKRLLLNVAPWREGPPPADAVVLDVGAYDSRLGLSYGELAALSRSQHKSQGFGVPGERGPLLERFVLVAGSRPSADILEGVETGWGRYGAAAAPLVAALDDARAALDRDAPERALPALLRARRALLTLPDSVRSRDARLGLDDVVTAAMGLFVRATASRAGAVPGARVPATLELVLRRPATVTVRRVVFAGGTTVEPKERLALNEKKEIKGEVAIARDAAVSSPYWLAEPMLPARQVVKDLRLVGQPVGPAAVTVTAELTIDDQAMTVTAPLVYAWNDRVHGERVRSFLVTPPMTVTPVRDAFMFPNGERRAVHVVVRAAEDKTQGTVALQLPKGWRVEPERLPVALDKAGDAITVSFSVTPGKTAGALVPVAEVGGRAWSWREDVIDYAHIPMQVVLQPARARVVPLSLRAPAGTLGYVEGSGDTLAQDLRHLGLTVETIDDATLTSGDLARFAAIVVGIRAYNTRSVVKNAHTRLMRYVEQGGSLVVQYNTNSRFDVLNTPVGPYPLEIGRERVTNETAAIEPVGALHAVLQHPNTISAGDFAGWVQERGLYFAGKWDERYVPVLQAADPGEAPLLGGLLVARHGRGRYVYTGLAFFRQLPAGVPGAYRLFVNLLSPEAHDGG